MLPAEKSGMKIEYDLNGDRKKEEADTMRSEFIMWIYLKSQ